MLASWWGLWLLLHLVAPRPGSGPAPDPTWVEDSYEDFADGKLDASGQNLYISRDGTVRTIHRFDLNQDGYLDLIFNSTHDTYGFIPASWATLTSDGKIHQALVPVEGSTQVAVGDLNHDGYSDLVFCPNEAGIQHPRRFLTISWGGPDGWPGHRVNGLLPVYGATSVAIADLNTDGWPDLIALNREAWLPRQPAGRIIRIFWGSPAGYLATRHLDFGVAGAIQLAAADFDLDGARDVAILTDNKVKILWAEQRATGKDVPELALPGPGSRCLAAADADLDGYPDLIVGTDRNTIYIVPGQTGRSWEPAISLHSSPASQIAVGDLDGDRRPDMVITDLFLARALGGEVVGARKGSADLVRILWGEKEELGFSGSTELRVPHAAASAIGDFNGDGQSDLAVAVYQGAQTFKAESPIFIGKGKRQFERTRQGVRTEGATDVAAVRIKGGPSGAVFCNSRGGTVDERVPLFVYWGNAHGFSPSNVWKIPFKSGNEASAADLNADGFVDLVVLNSGHAGEASAAVDPELGAHIYWGGREGFNLERRTILREYNLASSNVADLNRDGYLDLVLGAFTSQDKEKAELVIYYGLRGDFSRKRRAVLRLEGGAIACVVADYNQDGWLDVVTTSPKANRVSIFWGGSEGFQPSRSQSLDVPKAIDAETADLNQDGWLDLVIGTYNDPLEGYHDTGLLIFWGSREGFRYWDAQWLPGMTPVGITIADFDKDAFLDIFSPHYHAELTRESLPCYLYWGGRDGFSARRRTSLIADSAHDALAGDFDEDGLIDLAVSCHTRDGDHRTFSKVIYNDGSRFTNPRVILLPTVGTHYMWSQDLGHILHRQWEQTYDSSSFDLNAAMSGGELSYTAEIPSGTQLRFAIRSAATRDGIEHEAWREIHSGSFSLSPQDRSLQYRATFQSSNGDRYPVLDRVSISFHQFRSRGFEKLHTHGAQK